MNVKTSSDQPQMRSKEHPYTALSLKVAKDPRGFDQQARRTEEMTFLSLLVQALSPRVNLTEVNKALRSVINHGHANNPELPLE